MKIFFVGDFVLNTGPGIANKMMRRGLGKNKNYLYSDAKNKFTRVLEIIYKTIIADCVCFCSSSKANIIGIKLAKLFKKKTFYIMHGYLAHEYKINNETIDESELKQIIEYERYVFANVDKVFCVSKKIMNYMKKAEPEFAEKFTYNFNGVDFDYIEEQTQKYNVERQHNQILSIGGGMRRKNNLTVCKAIDYLNREKKMDLKFVVVGLPYTDKEEICKYDFVTYYDYLPYEKVLELMSESKLYIQNSSFETFGLSVIEAVISGCNLLISDSVGAVDAITTITEKEIIYNTNDMHEIASKIEYVLQNDNAERLKIGLNKKEISYKNSALLLVKKIEELSTDNNVTMLKQNN